MKAEALIGIIGAMESEIEYLAGQLTSRTAAVHSGYRFHSGVLHGKRVVIVKCGVGKVNAARGTQLLIDRFAPDAVVNTGVAGALDPTLRVGDAVIASGLVQHDFDTTALGQARGYLCTGADPGSPTVFVSDPNLSNSMMQAARQVLSGCTVTRGIIATGDLFVANAGIRKEIRDTFGAAAVEMEAAAIAQTAAYAGIPFAVLRVMSDSADGRAAESFERFEAETAARSAAVIEVFIRRL